MNPEHNLGKQEHRSGIHPGYVYIFDVEAEIESSGEPQSLVKVGASGENAPADALEKDGNELGGSN